MTLTKGSSLGPYQIVESLGAGGMGEVYRARDTRLGRDVALKVLRSRIAADPDALERFQREAQAVAALSHPSILAIHDIGTDGDVRYAVTELLEGETLRTRLDRETLAWRKAVEIGIAIAEGLASAHARGIVHRDLKPENVFLTNDGRTKILDFGLARLEPVEQDDSGTRAPTLTDTGAIVGTPAYMSPEQIRAAAVDGRSDIFSFGSVLYEMVTGRRAFPGGTPADIISTVLRDQPPDPEESGKRIPVALARVVTRCLEKSPDERFQSARDLAFALKEIGGDAAAASETPRPRARRIGAGVVLAAAAAVFLAILALVSVGRRGGTPAPPRAVVPASAHRTVPAALESYARGRRLWGKRDQESLKKAVLEFQAAIDADPLYASGYAGLADCYAQLGYNSYEAPGDAFPKASAAAAKAIELDPSLGEAHASAGYVRMYWGWDFAGAEKEFREAIRLAPGYGPAHQWYAYLLTVLERPAPEALGEASAAQRIDPLSPAGYLDLAFISLYYGDLAGAEKSIKTAFELDPNVPLGYFWLGRLCTVERRFPEAEAALMKTQQLLGWTPTMAARGVLYAAWGKPEEARKVLAEFAAKSSKGEYAAPYALAGIYVWLGDKERALELLEAAYREHSHWLLWLRQDPRWSPLRDEPRFKDLTKRIGLPS